MNKNEFLQSIIDEVFLPQKRDLLEGIQDGNIQNLIKKLNSELNKLDTNEAHTSILSCVKNSYYLGYFDGFQLAITALKTIVEDYYDDSPRSTTVN